MLDGVEPGVIDEIHHAAEHIAAIKIVEAKARWIGHKLHTDVAIAVDESLPLVCGQQDRGVARKRAVRAHAGIGNRKHTLCERQRA